MNHGFSSRSVMPQDVVGQNALDEVGDAVDHLPNVEDIGQDAQQAVEHLEIRCDITRMR